MKTFGMLAAILLFTSGASAQSNNSLSIKNGVFGWQFYQNNKKLKTGEVIDVMESNPKALAYYQSARENNTWASLSGTIGGFLLGYPLGQAAGGGDPNWTLAAVGGGLIIVSIPLTIKANRQARSSVATYNEGLKTTSLRTTYNIGFTGNGVGLVVHF